MSVKYTLYIENKPKYSIENENYLCPEINDLDKISRLLEEAKYYSLYNKNVFIEEEVKLIDTNREQILTSSIYAKFNNGKIEIN